MKFKAELEVRNSALAPITSRALSRQNTTYNLNLTPVRRQQKLNRLHLLLIRPRRSIHNPANIAQDTSRHAHWTRLQRAINRASGKINRQQPLSHPPNRHHLGMRRRIKQILGFVPARGQHLAVLHNQTARCAQRRIRQIAPRRLDCQLHEMFICHWEGGKRLRIINLS